MINVKYVKLDKEIYIIHHVITLIYVIIVKQINKFVRFVVKKLLKKLDFLGIDFVYLNSMENKELNIPILSETNRKFYSKKKKRFQMKLNTNTDL